MAFNPANDITRTSLGNLLTPIGQGAANVLGNLFPGLRNGLSRSGGGNAITITPPPEKVFTPSSQALVFPADLPDSQAHFKLELKEYKKPSASSPGNDGPSLASIYLPIPSNLTENFAMEYNTAQFGPVLGDPSALKTVGGVGEAISAATRGNATTGMREERQAAAKEFVEKLSGSAASLLLRAGARAINEQQGGAYSDLFMGATPNPGFALLFNYNKFRVFKFTWRFAPSTPEESNMLSQILLTIKHAMHPGKKELFLTFPFRAFPKIWVKPKEIFPFKPCVITSLDVNYAPGTPAFFTDGKPVEIDVSIGLQETEIFTRDDFKLQASVDYNDPN